MVKFNKISWTVIILLILFFIAPGFAADNETDGVLAEIDMDDSSDMLATVDIYVNSSAEVNGNGSADSPYSSLDSVRIEKDNVVHLSDGEYTYRSYRTLNNVTIIGESADNTVIKCSRLEITSNNLILKNLTIIGATFKNQGDFTAENVIFKNSVGQMLDEYGNSFGGCIYTSYRQDDEAFHTISLNDCHFINNTAQYGGAIYIDEGYLEINRCLFISNHAFNYGGAICAVNANKATIKKSRFINDYSQDDVGGAIYVCSSSLTMEDSDILNCSALFGAGITGLNAKLDINNLHASGNNAKYEGGAIYQMYGTSLITASDFLNNSANNGGALFLDNVTSLFLISNKFTNNTAKICAGAFYSLSNTEYQNSGNIYENNHALVNNDMYNISMINPIIADSDYATFKYTPLANNIILPSYYNLVDDGYVTPVKDQQDGGNCWSFAVLAALESCILKAANATHDFSEENMKNLMASFSDYGWQIDVNEGGYDDMGIGYLAGWLGPVSESDDAYDDSSTISPLLSPLMHVQNVIYLKRNSYLDNFAIKEAILRYGAVATGIYYSGLYLLGNSYYYYDTIMPSNHAVTIVGWDDSYSKYNFNRVPQGDGAFIVKNSWGDDWCDGGYFYVSYYDTKFAQVGKDEVSYTFILNDTIRYDRNYQYDISGKTDYLITGEDTIWYQNIFTATDSEYLAAVSTYFNDVTEWDVSVYVNDVFKMTKSGKSPAGYFTINLGDLIELHEGDVFKVVFKLACDNFANIPIIESNYINKVPFSYGVSYFSRDGENWIDLFNYTFSDFNHRYVSQIACIKAFTVFNTLNSTIKLDVSDKGVRSANIRAIVADQYGNLLNSGEVVFTIGDIQYRANVTNGIANVTHAFGDVDSSMISAVYKSLTYNSSHAESQITFYDEEMAVNIESVQYGESIIAAISLFDDHGNNLNDDVFITLANKTFKAHVNGKLRYAVPVSLDVGSYTAVVECNSLKKNVSFTISRAKVAMTVNIDNQRESTAINLVFSKPVNEIVNISVSGKNYTVTAVNGKANLTLDDLDYGTHMINISFVNGNYEEVFANCTIQKDTFKSAIAFAELKYLDDGVLCTVNLFKLNGEPIASKQVTVRVLGNEYVNMTGDDGSAGVILDLANGNYEISVSFGGYENILPCEANFTLNVNRKEVTVENIACSSQIKVFDNANITITFSDNANGQLSFYVDGKEYMVGHVRTNNVNVTLSSMSCGNHKITIGYRGIEGYSYSKTFDVNVIRTAPSIQVITGNLNAGKDSTITFNLPENAQGYIFADINGKSYYSMISNGKAIFNIDALSEGRNVLQYSYDGDGNYTPLSGDYIISLAESVRLSGNSDVTMKYGDGSSYKVRLTGASGSVKITVDGKSQYVPADINGWVSFKISLKPKTYLITAQYGNVEVSNKIIVKSILKLNTAKIKKSAKKPVIKVSLAKINDKYLKGKKIVIKFNGKKYSVKTNKNGVAKLTLKKSIVKKLKANKKYSIQLSYQKDLMKRSIIVKKL